MLVGPPRLVALSFQVPDGRIASDDDGKPLIADMFDDPALDLARREAVLEGQTFRRIGEFEPARIGPDKMEYSTIQTVLENLGKRFTLVIAAK